MLRDLAHELFARACEVAQFLRCRGRHEAGAYQAMRQQVVDPHRIIDVRLASGDVVDAAGIGKNQLELALEDVPDRFPIDARRLRANVRAAVQSQPVSLREQPGRRGSEAAPRCWGAALACAF